MAFKYTEEQLNKLDKELLDPSIPGNAGIDGRTDQTDTVIK